ncbi:hypothetical protein JCM30237_04870 [Halolamina litorea]
MLQTDPTPIERWPHGRAMKASTLVLVFGAVLFVLPIPGTFVAGALVLLAGALARWLGS